MYNQDKLIDIIKASQGHLSLNEFARISDIDSAYLSRILNKKRTNPPSPKVLKKLADASHGVTTYEELMTICGHIDENDLNSYLLGMLGLTKLDEANFNNQLKEISLSDYEEKIYSNIIEDMQNAILNKDKSFKLNIDQYINNESFQTQSKIMQALNLYMRYLKQMSDFTNTDSIKTSENFNNTTHLSKIPILGTVKAGYDWLAEENVIGYITDKDTVKDYEKNINEYYALKVIGDSMLPLLSEGDLVIVHDQDDVESGQTAIVLINGEEATIKKIVKTNEGIELHSMNPYYPVKKFTFEDVKNIPIKIIGRVKEAKIKGAFE